MFYAGPEGALYKAGSAKRNCVPPSYLFMFKFRLVLLCLPLGYYNPTRLIMMQGEDDSFNDRMGMISVVDHRCSALSTQGFLTPPTTKKAFTNQIANGQLFDYIMPLATTLFFCFSPVSIAPLMV